MANPREDNPDWRQGYGFQFWLARHGYRGDGAYGQFCVVLPEQQTVVAITGATIDMQAVLDGLWTHLLPALSDDHRSSPDKTAADVHLARRMTSLALTPATGKPDPEEDADRWDGAVFTPVDGRCEQQPTLTSVELNRAADGWQITLGEDGRQLSGAFGDEDWLVSDAPEADGTDGVPVAVSGGWDGGRLTVEVLFLETPHRLTVSCERADGDVHGDLGHGAAAGRHAARPAQAGVTGRSTVSPEAVSRAPGRSRRRWTASAPPPRRRRAPR